MRKKINKKRGLSPVITSLLLVALVVVISAVIFLWFRGMVEEGVTKFGKNIQLVCDDVTFDASYSSGVLSIVNTGNIPIYTVNVQSGSNGNFQTKDIKQISSKWPTTGLNQGATFSDTISDLGSSITVYPVLIGTSGSGKKTFVCEGQYGKQVTSQ